MTDDGHPKLPLPPIVVKRRADHPKQLRLALLEFAMRKESLALLPVAWGRASELAVAPLRASSLTTIWDRVWPEHPDRSTRPS